MKNIVKKISIGVVSLGVVTGSFALGSYASDVSWKTQVLTKANQEIGAAGYNKKNELISNIDQAIEDRVVTAADGKIDSQEQTVEQELESYFDSKIDEIIETPEFEALDGDLSAISSNVVNRYKAEIDTAFANR